jgi:hypothetical protein
MIEELCLSCLKEEPVSMMMMMMKIIIYLTQRGTNTQPQSSIGALTRLTQMRNMYNAE